MSQELVLLPPWRSVQLVGRGVFIELLRRKDLYVLAFFMGLFLLGVAIVRLVGIENAATATFLLNLGLTLAYFSAHLLTLLLTARQMPDEVENRTLYPLLAKPLERRHLLAGKWAAATAGGTLVYAALFLVAWGFTPRYHAYSTGCLLQMLLLQPVSIGMLSAFALCGSLFMPRAVNLVVLLTLFMGGSAVAGLLSARLRPAFAWVASYLPRFSDLNLTMRYTDGIGALGAGEFLAIAAYALIFTVLALSLAAWRFERRAL